MDHRSEPTPVGAIKSLDELHQEIEGGRIIYFTIPYPFRIIKIIHPPPLIDEHTYKPHSVLIHWDGSHGYTYWFNNEGAIFAPFGTGNGWIFTNYWHAWAYGQKNSQRE